MKIPQFPPRILQFARTLDKARAAASPVLRPLCADPSSAPSTCSTLRVCQASPESGDSASGTATSARLVCTGFPLPGKLASRARNTDSYQKCSFCYIPRTWDEPTEWKRRALICTCSAKVSQSTPGSQDFGAFVGDKRHWRCPAGLRGGLQQRGSRNLVGTSPLPGPSRP